MAKLVWAILCLMLAAANSSNSEGQPPKCRSAKTAWKRVIQIRFNASETNVYMLNDMCDKTTDVEHFNVTSGVFILHNKKSTVRVDFSCFITLKAPPRHHVLLKFVEADIDAGWLLMCEDYVFIFDTKYVHQEDKDKKEPIGKVVLCGDDPPDDTYVSAGREMTIYYHTNVFASDEGYKMYFSAVHAGTCGSGDFECDNGFCINVRLKCNGYDNCGDESDMCPSILPMILGGVGAGLFVCIVVVCCCYCRRKGPPKQDNKDKADTTETIPMTAPTKAASQPYPKYVPRPSPTRGYVPPPQSAMSQGQHYDQSKAYPSPPSPGQGAYPGSHQDAYYPPPPPGESGYPPQGQGTYSPPRYSPSVSGYPSQQDVYTSAPPTSRDDYSPPEYTPPTQGYPESAAYDKRA